MDRSKNILVAESILHNDNEYINPLERIENAAKTLGPTSFKLWAWLSAQPIGTKIPQSATFFYNAVGISRNSYIKALEELEQQNYFEEIEQAILFYV